MRLSKTNLISLLSEQNDESKKPPRKVDVEPYPFQKDEVNPDNWFKDDPEGKAEWDAMSEEERNKIVSNRKAEAAERYEKSKAAWDEKQQQEADSGPTAEDKRREYLEKDVEAMERQSRAVTSTDPRERQAAMDLERARRRGWTPPKGPVTRVDPLTGEKEERYVDQGGAIKWRRYTDRDELKKNYDAWQARVNSPEKRAEVDALQAKAEADTAFVDTMIKNLMADKDFAARWNKASGFDKTSLRGYIRSQGGIDKFKKEGPKGPNDVGPGAPIPNMNAKDVIKGLEAAEGERKGKQQKLIDKAKTWGVNLTDDQLKDLTPAEINNLINQSRKGAMRGARGGGSAPAATGTSSGTGVQPSGTSSGTGVQPSGTSSGTGSRPGGTPTAASSKTSTSSTSYFYGTSPSVGPTSVMASVENKKPQTQATLNYATYQKNTGSPEAIIAAASGKGASGLPSASTATTPSVSNSQYDSGQIKFGSTVLAKDQKSLRGAKRAVGVKTTGGYDSQVTDVLPALAENIKFKKNELKLLIEQISTAARETVRTPDETDFGDSTFAKIATAPVSPILLPPGMRIPTSITDIGFTPSNLKRGLKYYNNPALAAMFLGGLGGALKTGGLKGWEKMQGTKARNAIEKLIFKSRNAANLANQFAGKVKNIPVIGELINTATKTGKSLIGDEQLREKLAREMYASLIDVRARGVEIPTPKEKPEPTEVKVTYGP